MPKTNLRRFALSMLKNKPRRRKRAGALQHQLEACEERILLSATGPADIMDGTDFYDTTADGPLGDEFANYEDEFSGYSDGYDELVGDAYDQANDEEEQNTEDAPPSDGNGAGEASALQASLSEMLGDFLMSQPAEGELSINVLDQPSHVSFADVALPVESDFADLFSVVPDGTESFSTTTTTTDTAQPLDENGNVIADAATTNLTQDVTVAQDIAADGSWTVTQSVADTFDNQDFDAETGLAARTGYEQYTVSVIDGSTTVRTHEVHDRRLGKQYSDGTETVSLGPDTDADYEIDTGLIDESTGNGTSTREWGSGEPDGFTFTNTGLTSTVTETQVTLDDGTEAIRKTLSLSWYIGVNYVDSGEYGNELLESDTDPATIPASFSATATGGWEVSVSASVGGHLTFTTVTPVGGTESIASMNESSFGFAMTAFAGGGSTLTTHFQQDESSGDDLESTDEYDRFDLEETVT